MIVLDYRLGPDRELDTTRLAVAGELDLRYDWFLGDVTFVLDGADFSAPWGWVPILDFALGLRAVARGAAADGVERFEFTESEAHLDVVRVGDAIEVTADYAAGTGRAPVAVLLAATDGFVGRVVTELTARYPELARNPVAAGIRWETH